MGKLLKNNSGEGYIDVVALIICAMMVIALAIKVFPVYIAKQQLDTFATELVREAEITGNVGSETAWREAQLKERLDINPTVTWSKYGHIQLNEEVSVTATYIVNIGLFGEFGAFPIELKGRATGQGEVYWK